MNLLAPAGRLLADPIGPHQPSGSGLPGSAAIDTLISWSMYGALVLCVLAAILAGGLMAVGRLSERPHMAVRGQSALLWAVIGALVVGIAIPLVNKAFGLG